MAIWAPGRNCPALKNGNLRKPPIKKGEHVIVSTPIPLLAQIYQVSKTLGNGLCTLEIIMLDLQLLYFSAYYKGKLDFWVRGAFQKKMGKVGLLDQPRGGGGLTESQLFGKISQN